MILSFSSKFGLATIAGAALLAGCASGGVLRQAQDDMATPSGAVLGHQTDGTVYVYRLNGTSGTEVGSTTLSGSSDVNGSWIMDITHPKSKREELDVLAPQQNGADTLIYGYPSGGISLGAFTGVTQPFGATYSGYGHRTF